MTNHDKFLQLYGNLGAYEMLENFLKYAIESEDLGFVKYVQSRLKIANESFKCQLDSIDTKKL